MTLKMISNFITHLQRPIAIRIQLLINQILISYLFLLKTHFTHFTKTAKFKIVSNYTNSAMFYRLFSAEIRIEMAVFSDKENAVQICFVLIFPFGTVRSYIITSHPKWMLPFFFIKIVPFIILPKNHSVHICNIGGKAPNNSIITCFFVYGLKNHVH